MQNQKNNPSLWSKVKSLFSIDEEVFQEEPLHPNAEKYKEKKISKNFVFGFILAFLILVNILIGFNLNQFYIRAILGFLFIILVPGALIMLMMKIREVGFWEYLVYTVGLSVSFIMFAGLAVNWILPWLMITSKPLQLKFILPIFDLILLVFWIIAYKRNADMSEIKLKIPQLDLINNIFFIIPILFPFMAVIGAFLLNNHGTNIVTMIMLGGIALYVLLVVIFRKRLNPNVYPWAIWMIGLAILLSFSMRGWFISGGDISIEAHMFNISLENKFWNILVPNDAYNTLLSITIYPLTGILFMGVNLELFFKLLIQIIFSLTIIEIYLISKNIFNNPFAFYSSFFFISSFYFGSILPTMIRQEIAFLFFGLILLVFFNKRINSTLKKFLFVIFGFSMIVSHYSTSYVALALFLLTYLLSIFYKLHETRKIKKEKSNSPKKEQFYLTGILLLLLLVFGFIWYSQITSISSGLINTLENSLDNFKNIFDEDMRSVNVKQALFSTSADSYSYLDLQNYSNLLKKEFSQEESILKRNLGKNYPVTFTYNNYLNPKNNYSQKIIIYLYRFTKYFIILSLVLGSIFILTNFMKKRYNLPKEFLIISLLSFFFVVLIIVLPYVSQAYNFERVYQQSLFILCTSSIIGFVIISNFFKTKQNLFIIIFLIYFLVNQGFFTSLIGGDTPLNLYNSGITFEAHHLHNTEFSSISWLDLNKRDYIINLDFYSSLKMVYLTSKENQLIKKTMHYTIGPENYVYVSFTNMIHNKNYIDDRDNLAKGILQVNFPTEFLNENKNKIYNNGGSEIFK